MKSNHLIAISSATVFAGLAIIVACSGSSSSSSSSGSTALNLLSNLTTVTTITGSVTGYNTVTGAQSTATASCPQVTRDTSSCQSARTALGLSGNWLKFSCALTLGLATNTYASTTTYASASYVSITMWSLPDHTSNFYSASSTSSYSFTANGNTYSGTYASMNASYSPPANNPNVIAQQSKVMYVPINPASGTVSSHQSMSMGAVGIAIDGVAIYDARAANSDNIFQESGTFDGCQGHPDGSSGYHYHTEPWGISYNDNNLIGVMMDGYFIYGRKDHDGTTLSTAAGTDGYIYGGHVGASPVDGTSYSNTFHYHATAHSGCVHQRTTAPKQYSDDGNTTCSLGTGGFLVTAYFLTGHGNGFVFATPPSPTADGATSAMNTAATKSYYGSAIGKVQ